MTEPKYFASGSKDEFERERLGLLDSVLDPQTIRRLEALGDEVHDIVYRKKGQEIVNSER